MSSAQEQTVARYHELMQVNAASHILRSARQTGLLDQLRERQRTLDELCNELSLRVEPTRLLLDALIAVGMVEQYGDDLALSQAARLLCQYDDDLGDSRWKGLTDSLSVSDSNGPQSNDLFFDHQAATQWVHTPAAMQAAEVLDVGGDELRGCRILDLGCGSGVWSCAMAHRDQAASITLVDHAGALQAAKSTAASIDLTERTEPVEGDPLGVPLSDNTYDLVLIAERIKGLGDHQAGLLIDKAVAAAKPGGRVVVIDLFRGPPPKESKGAAGEGSAAEDSKGASEEYARPSLAESIEALKVLMGTESGRIRTLQQAQQMLTRAGLAQVQFAYLSASRLNLGIAVGVKPDTA